MPAKDELDKLASTSFDTAFIWLRSIAGLMVTFVSRQCISFFYMLTAALKKIGSYKQETNFRQNESFKICKIDINPCIEQQQEHDSGPVREPTCILRML